MRGETLRSHRQVHLRYQAKLCQQNEVSKKHLIVMYPGDVGKALESYLQARIIQSGVPKLDKKIAKLEAALDER